MWNNTSHLPISFFNFLNPRSFQYGFAFPGSNEITQENLVKRVYIAFCLGISRPRNTNLFWIHYKLFDFINSSNIIIIVNLKKVWEFTNFTPIPIIDFDSVVVRNHERNEERFETHYEKNIIAE